MQGLEIAQRLRDEMRDLQATTRLPPGPKHARTHAAARLASRSAVCTACYAVCCVAVGGDCEQTARSYAATGVHVGRQPSQGAKGRLREHRERADGGAPARGVEGQRGTARGSKSIASDGACWGRSRKDSFGALRT